MIAILTSDEESTFVSNPMLAKVDVISPNIEEDHFKVARKIVIM